MKRFFRAFTLGDVLHHDQELAWITRVIADDTAGSLCPNQLAVLTNVALLYCVMDSAVLQHRFRLFPAGC